MSLSATLLIAVSASGCEEDTQATPRVTFESTVVPGTHSSADCPEKGTWFTIGDFGNPAAGKTDPNNPESPLKLPVIPIEDGAPDQQGTVSLSCAVKERGDGFDVAASASLTGATGGFFSVVGFFKASGEQPNITVTVSRESRAYRQTDCVATYDTAVGHGVAPGRVWATVKCPNARVEDLDRTCLATSQFRLENCAQ